MAAIAQAMRSDAVQQHEGDGRLRSKAIGMTPACRRCRCSMRRRVRVFASSVGHRRASVTASMPSPVVDVR